MPRTEWEYSVRTPARHALVNVTAKLADAVHESGLASGIACVSVPHTTCALVVNEDEAGLREDILRLVREVIEPLRERAPFAHDRIDHNAAAHLAATLLQCSLAIPVADGKPALGTWQSLFLVELDGPRTRILRVTLG